VYKNALFLHTKNQFFWGGGIPSPDTTPAGEWDTTFPDPTPSPRIRAYGVAASGILTMGYSPQILNSTHVSQYGAKNGNGYQLMVLLTSDCIGTCTVKLGVGESMHPLEFFRSVYWNVR